MATLSAEAKSLIAEIHPGLVATASKTGQPNVSAKGTFRVLDDEHVLFADVNSPRTMANLAENPQVSVLILDPATRRGCRLWGKTGSILDSGDLFDQVSSQLAPRQIQPKHVVVISVEKSVVF